MRGRKTLGENISKLVTSNNVANLEIPSKSPLTHKVVIHFNMFGFGMENRILSNGKGRHIVTPKLRRKRKKNHKVL